MSALVIAEHDHAKLKPSTASVVAAAGRIPGPVHVLVAGSHCQQAAEEAGSLAGVSSVLVADATHYEHFLAEELAALVNTISTDYSHILAPSNTFGKNLMPRVAGLLDTGMISDVLEIIDDETFIRPMYAGNVLATVQSDDHRKILTVRTTAFEPVETGKGNAETVLLEPPPAQGLSRFVSLVRNTSDRPDVTTAKVVIAGGRGLASSENFAMLEKLADRLGGAVAGTRAAVDAGFVPNDLQVGQTGKIIAPELYIAVGISGAIQHLAGIKESKCIVAINRDEEAPIFEHCDYFLVKDLFSVLPELIERL